MNFKKILKESYNNYVEQYGDSSGDISKEEFLSSEVFQLTTYDSEMDHLLVEKIMDVVMAIHEKKTFDYIEDEDNYKWYIICVNLPWFKDKLEWGTSIRGAWWEYFAEKTEGWPYDRITQIGSGFLYIDGKQSEISIANREDWNNFVNALIEFYWVR